MDKRPMNEMMDIAMQKVREMIDANTVVGKPITTVDNITLIPVSRVTIGFAGGGGGGDAGGSGIGTGFKVEPVAFIVIKDDNISVLYVAPPAETAIERLIDIAPLMVDKITDLLTKKDEVQ